MSRTPSCLLVAADDLRTQLAGTWVWQRRQIVQYHARDFDDALGLARRARPLLVVIEREFARSEQLVRELCREMLLTESAITVMAGSEIGERDLDLLDAGANGIFRLPPGPDWDRLGGFLGVGVRRASRLSLSIDISLLAVGCDPALGVIVNLSETGVLVETPSRLALGQSVKMVLRPGDDRGLMMGTGRIVRVNDTSLGIDFSHLDERARLWLDGAWSSLS